MRKVLILLLFLPFISFAQVNIEYISEKCDSMAFINKTDVDIINDVFEQRNQLLELNRINSELIENLELNNSVLNAIISTQKITINNHEKMILDLENRNNHLKEQYEKDLRKEQNKKISFQTISGIGVIVIIILLL